MQGSVNTIIAGVWTNQIVQFFSESSPEEAV